MLVAIHPPNRKYTNMGRYPHVFRKSRREKEEVYPHRQIFWMSCAVHLGRSGDFGRHVYSRAPPLDISLKMFSLGYIELSGTKVRLAGGGANLMVGYENFSMKVLRKTSRVPIP